MAAQEATDTVSLAPDNVRLTHDLASVFCLADADFASWFTLTAAATQHEDIFNAETHGHRIVKKEAEMLPAPFVLHFTGEGEDMIVFAFKHRNGLAYYYGVSSSKVKDFVPPAKPGDFKEQLFFRTVKCSDETVSHASRLVDTESVKFRAKVAQILALTPMFVATKLTTLAAIDRWQNEKSFVEIVKVVVEQAELAERKKAKDKGDKAADAAVSQEGGSDAKKRWEEVRRAACKWAPWYEQEFASRFIVCEDKEAYEACAADLEKHKLKAFLLPALLKVKDDSLTNAPPPSPFKRLLEPPPDPRKGEQLSSDSDDEDIPLECLAAAKTAPAKAAAPAAAAAAPASDGQAGDPAGRPKRAPKPPKVEKPEEKKPKGKQPAPKEKKPAKPQVKVQPAGGTKRAAVEDAAPKPRGRPRLLPGRNEPATAEQVNNMWDKIDQLEARECTHPAPCPAPWPPSQTRPTLAPPHDSPRAAGEADALQKVSALEAEKAKFTEELHAKEKKIVKLATQVQMGGNVFSAMQMGMKMASKSGVPSFDSPAGSRTSGSSSSSAASTADPFKGLFTVASPD